MSRPLDKHIDREELGILVPWPTDPIEGEEPRHSVETMREVHRHLASCSECRGRLITYRQIVGRLSGAANSDIGTAGSKCPKEIDWNEVVAGLWPEMKARQLIRHAALCDHCGPMLRGATREASFRRSSEVHAGLDTKPAAPPARRWQAFSWMVPLCSAMVVLVIFVGIPMTSSTALSGTKYAEFAAHTHTEHVQGSLALEVRSNSLQAVNDWLRQNAQFSVSLPGAPEAPYRLEGASLVRVGDRRAAFVAYQLDSGPVSLIVAPNAVAVASGGAEAHFNKVTFHYRTVNGLKVVTWSQHGLTYALVSQEGPRTQKSCMVCHSAMKDRDLSQTPTPLDTEKNTIRSYLQ